MEYALVFILTVLTIIFWNGKGSWLIAGYNTMDEWLPCLAYKWRGI